MNRCSLILAGVLLSIGSCRSQTTPIDEPQPVIDKNGEFPIYSNGLIYSPSDMRVLGHIVDSLNIRFRTCEPNPSYISLRQKRVYMITFRSETNDLKQIIKQIENNASPRELLSQFGEYAESADSTRLIIERNKPEGEDEYPYVEGSASSGFSTSYTRENGREQDFRDWDYDYHRKDGPSKKYTLYCSLYSPEWQQSRIPARYARLIQYVDCMVDTSASIFIGNTILGWDTKSKNPEYFNLYDIVNYINDKMKAVPDKKTSKDLTEPQVKFAIDNLKSDKTFRALLANTIDGYAKNKTPQYELEEIASGLGMHDKALLMKRCYMIMGGCSQDSRPRDHAREIAALSARAHSWDIFLRAHLDIMNDNFARVSDASYAWGGRKTYLKELEELNLNIVDLMLGLTLRADNLAENHYYGTIWRLGWALTESKERDVFEKKVSAMLRDNTLDEFNRSLLFMLYESYLTNLEEKESRAKVQALNDDASSYPDFIQVAIHQLKKKEKDE